MKSILSLLALALGSALLSSCAGNNPHNAFKARYDYPKTSEVFRNEAVYSKAKPNNTTVRIDLSDQRAQLLVGKEVAIDTPVCTGKSRKRTPVGSYPIINKKADKRSTIFGTYYYKGRRVHVGDRRKYRGRRDRYRGASLPYWMRMTDDGIGMHGSSYVHRYPGSNGCVRTPHDVIDDIYRKCRKGTSIVVVP